MQYILHICVGVTKYWKYIALYYYREDLSESHWDWQTTRNVCFSLWWRRLRLQCMFLFYDDGECEIAMHVFFYFMMTGNSMQVFYGDRKFNACLFHSDKKLKACFYFMMTGNETAMRVFTLWWYRMTLQCMFFLLFYDGRIFNLKKEH